MTTTDLYQKRAVSSASEKAGKIEWQTAAESRDYVARKGISDPTELIIGLAAKGHVAARCELVVNEVRSSAFILPKEIWDRDRYQLLQRNWKVGFFKFSVVYEQPIDRDSDVWEAFSVCFDKKSLISFFHEKQNSNAKKSSLKPISLSAINNWLDGLGGDLHSQSYVTLLERARATFPDKQISRDPFRAAVKSKRGPTKPGPKSPQK